MREILFRGKREDNGEWVEGFLIGRYDPMQKEHIIKNAFIDNGTCFYDPDKVIPETIGQFTGLFDKNGKRIFEGDIVKLEEDVRTFFRIRNGEVSFIGGSFLVGDNGYNLLSTLYALTNQDGILRGEVIGNIHDNPELLN
jgi:uncharacterized phage protein (TIGR01671 family)